MNNRLGISLFSLLIGTTVIACGAINDTQSTTENSNQATYLDASLSADARAKALVSQMTLAEKVGQMFDKAPAIPRLNVPQYHWWNEALHGVARAGTATVFPQAIGLASTFDTQLINEVGKTVSDEGRAKHHAFLENGVNSMYTGLTYWSPNINIFRDPRWGRGQETYGEDPYLTTQIAANFVNGLQGDDPKYLKSVATLKHYAVHSGPEISRHSDDYLASPKDLTETYLAAFRDTIALTDVSSVMCAYNRVNGAPACGSTTLLEDTLRKEFNFTGYIVSDCGAIADFYDPNSHGVVNTEAKAAAMAVNAGTDINCGDHHGNTFSYLVDAVEQGLIAEQKIDQAVIRLFAARFKLGMFDNSDDVPFANLPLSIVGSATHTDLALKAAEKSFVMLKNNGVLPLPSTTTIALIGPNADNKAVLVGNYHGTPVNPITPKTALSDALGSKLLYAPGAPITGDVRTNFEVLPSTVFFHKDYDGEVKPGLIATYYPDSHFGNQPVKRDIVANVDFEWLKSPVSDKLEQEFSIKWQGFLVPETTAKYRFQAKNFNLSLDGKAVSGDIILQAGKQYQLSAESKLHHFWHSNVVQPSAFLKWTNLDIDLTKQAIAAAKQSDVIVFVGGISANLEGEEMPLAIDGFAHGDRTHINLPKSQLKLLKQLKTLNKPIIMVNMSGSAIALNWENKNLDAIIQGFYPGEATGLALKHILFGDVSPSGKLPITFYKGVKDLPDFKDYKMTNRTYKYYQGEVLYPFGHGLTYANQSVRFNVTRSQYQAETGGLLLSADVSNTSPVSTEDVVQVYVTLHDTKATSPIRQLVHFQRINLPSNGTQTITLSIPEDKLTYVLENGKTAKHRGKMTVSVGNGQPIDGFGAAFDTIQIDTSK